MRLSLGQAAEVRLGRQRAPQYEQGDHVIPYLRSANVTDGALDLSDVKQMNFTPLEQTIFGLEDGDVLLTEGSGSRDTVGTSAVWRNEIDATVCFQNTLLRLRPRQGVTDGRFLEWWARHARTSGQIAAVSTGANILHIGSDGLKRLTMQVPAVDEQRRIADFLDDRVSRIDRTITARREQVDKADGLLQSQVLMDLARPSDVWAPLRRLGVAVTTGPFGTVFAADEYVDAGVPMINPSHIQNGEIVPDEKHSVSPETARRLSRHALRQGDLVVSRKGDIGRTAMVHAHQDGWLCGSDSIALHTSGSRMPPDALALLLTTSLLREQLLSQSNAATMPSLNEGNLLSLEVPVVTHDEQALRTAEAWKSHRSISNLKDMANGSIELLTEYKSSLITAAVTGELDVSTAGSNIPGVS